MIQSEFLMNPAEEMKDEDTTDQIFFTKPTEEKKYKETIEQCKFSTDTAKERKDEDTKIQSEILTKTE